MNIRNFVLVSTAMVFASTAFAQRFEVYGDYSYLQYNPTITGVNSRAFNGGGGGAQLNFMKYFGAKADFQGYGSTQVTVNVTSPIGTSQGIIPVGTYKSNFNMTTYMFGPVVQVPVKRVKPYFETLFGRAFTNGYASLYNQTIVGGSSDKAKDQHPFSMVFGGGLDVSLNNRVSLRLAEMDYVLTRFTNPFTNTNNQGSFRYQGGVVIKFGGL